MPLYISGRTTIDLVVSWDTGSIPVGGNFQIKDCCLIDSKRKGGVTELKCLAYLYELGYQVSTPFGENARYDLILDLDGPLVRVQVKTANEIEDGVFEFSCTMTRVNRTGVARKTYTKTEIDFFCYFL